MYSYAEKIPKIIPVTTYFKEVDKELLMSLMRIQTPTRDEKRQEELLLWIEQWIIDNVKKDCSIQWGQYGDLYITKGEADLYPAVISHVDTVHSYNENLFIGNIGNLIVGIDELTGEQHGIGADPKCGLYYCLEALKFFDNIKVALFRNEESGAINSSKCDMSFFKNCSFICQLDRRSFTNDVIEHTNGVQVLSEELKKEMLPIMRDYNYSFNHGSFTDCGAISKNGVGICCFNFSNGSINEHMDYEVASIPHLLNAINAVTEIILKLGYKKRWEHSPYVKQSSDVKQSSYKAEKKYLEKYDDYYDWEDSYMVDEVYRKDVRHYSEHYTFAKEDEAFIKDCLGTGVCSVCNSTDLVELGSGETVCGSCEAIYNIKNRSVFEILNDFDQLIEQKLY